MSREAVEHEAKRAIAAIHEGDMLTTQMAVLKRFAKRAPVTHCVAPSRRRCRSVAGPLPTGRPLATALLAMRLLQTVIRATAR